MKLTTTIFLMLILIMLSGCGLKDSASKKQAPPVNAEMTSSESPEAKQNQQQGQAGKQSGGGGGGSRVMPSSMSTESIKTQNVALDEALTSEENKQAIERKIIRNGKLTIETDTPAEGQSKLNSLAEEFGGFVVTSDYKQNDNRTASSEVVTVTIRIPAVRFDEVVTKIRAIGGRMINENVTGQDVTEEFIDLEARIKTQKALELQFLEIMKRATKVEDALQVQSEIANVRTEIERIEGRKRFLENQSALSTITVILQTPTPIVSSNPKGFWYSIKEAFGDGVEIASGFVLGLIRLVIAGIPVVLFIGLPLFFVGKYFWRRWKARREAEPIEVNPIPQE